MVAGKTENRVALVMHFLFALPDHVHAGIDQK